MRGFWEVFIKTKRLNILIVDDEDEIRKAYLQYFGLDEDEFNLFEAASGNKALEILNSNIIDFILSDVRMPDGDGIFLLDKVREKNPPPPFIALISGHTELTRESALKKGAIDLFQKPVDLDHITNLIKETCIKIQ